MANSLTFIGTPSGDGECFCFDVDERTFKLVLGEERYKIEKEHREEFRNTDGETIYPKDAPWRIYPGAIFKDKKNKIKVTITIEGV